MMSSSNVRIRLITPEDNPRIENCIRSVLIEYGANRPGLAWQDPELSELSEAYRLENAGYWVAEIDSVVIGGCGVAPLVPNLDGYCELQKMYIMPEARGQGIGKTLLDQALQFSKDHYSYCYLETLSNMTEAHRLYRGFGFERLSSPIIETEHSACDQWYLKTLAAT